MLFLCAAWSVAPDGPRASFVRQKSWHGNLDLVSIKAPSTSQSLDHRHHFGHTAAMSFAIEVPGEANPLSENLLIHSLRSASSSDPQQIQTGTKQVQQWEKSQGYYVHLQSAYLDRRLPLEIRYLAIIQLKNGIDKYWRKTAAK